jgi:hypothetical protein
MLAEVMERARQQSPQIIMPAALLAREDTIQVSRPASRCQRFQSVLLELPMLWAPHRLHFFQFEKAASDQKTLRKWIDANSYVGQIRIAVNPGCSQQQNWSTPQFPVCGLTGSG